MRWREHPASVYAQSLDEFPLGPSRGVARGLMENLGQDRPPHPTVERVLPIVPLTGVVDREAFHFSMPREVYGRFYFLFRDFSGSLSTFFRYPYHLPYSLHEISARA